MASGTYNVYPTSKRMLEGLKKLFHYYHDGSPDIYSYGAFKAGVTSDEIEDYLRVIFDKTNVKKESKKFYDIAGCNTCPMVIVNGQEVHLMYRHDVERFAFNLVKGTETYFD